MGLCDVTQLALDLEPPKLKRPPELMAIARKQGDRAIEAGVEKARSIDPAFVEKAGVHMLAYLKAHGVSSGELLTDSCKLAGIVSTDDRHFGAVFRSLLRQGLMYWAGPCKRVKGHASRGGSRYALAGAMGA
jgi:hypothetical protein